MRSVHSLLRQRANSCGCWIIDVALTPACMCICSCRAITERQYETCVSSCNSAVRQQVHISH